MAKQYQLVQQTYLRMKGGGDPILLDIGEKIGEGTPYDFEGPPNRAMTPLTDEARDALEEVERQAAGFPPTVKTTESAPEGGGTPFDPASPDKSNDVESGKTPGNPEASKDAAAAAKAKADEDAKAKAKGGQQ